VEKNGRRNDKANGKSLRCVPRGSQWQCKYGNSTIPYPKKIVLHCPSGYGSNLDAVVGEFIRDGVIFIGVVGRDCVKIEEIIDELVVGDGERNCHLLTSSHPNETVEDAVRFAASLTGEFKGEVHVIEI
jgi:hypothetical protein